MLHKVTILLLFVLHLSGIAAGQDVVFNMTGEFAVRPATASVPSPDINGYNGATFEFEAVFAQGSQSFIFPALFGDDVFQAQSATLTVTGATVAGSNGTFSASEPVLFRPRNGDFGRSLGIGLAPAIFDGTELALRPNSASPDFGLLLEPVFPLPSNTIGTDQFGSPRASISPIIFSDFANDFDAASRSDYGIVNLAVSVTAPVIHGDVNMDGAIDFLDIGPFVELVTAGIFQAEADCDGNGEVNFLDIPPFVDAIVNS